MIHKEKRKIGYWRECVRVCVCVCPKIYIFSTHEKRVDEVKSTTREKNKNTAIVLLVWIVGFMMKYQGTYQIFSIFIINYLFCFVIAIIFFFVDSTCPPVDCSTK